MSKPPVLSPPSQLDLATGLARLRAAAGKPERRVMHRVCSLQRKPFTVTWERFDPRQRFKIAAIEQIAEGDGKGVTAGERRQPATAFSVEEFDHTGIHCAWCGDRTGSVYHDQCDTTYCGGMKLRASDGGTDFLCPVCNVMFPTQNVDTLIGHSGRRPRGAAGASPAIEGGKRTMLPRWRK